jgi:hypothetical protein
MPHLIKRNEIFVGLLLFNAVSKALIKQYKFFCIFTICKSKYFYYHHEILFYLLKRFFRRLFQEPKGKKTGERPAIEQDVELPQRVWVQE